MVGAGITNNSRGMASAAKLHVYDRRTSHLPKLTEVAGENSVRFSNHSYRTHNNTFSAHGSYTTEDQTRDSIVYNSYYHLPVWAVGNDRDEIEDFDSLNAGIAKNILGIGAIEEITNGYAGASNVMLLAISGCGPTDDGRIKPDLVAGGFTGLVPATNSVSAYDTGVDKATSFAAPAVTGSLGLLQELHDRHYGTNAPLFASTYKGLIIHTADEAGDAPGPDYRFG